MNKSLCLIVIMGVMVSYSYGGESDSSNELVLDSQNTVPESSNKNPQRSVEENVIRGVKSIEVPRAICTSLEQCVKVSHGIDTGKWTAAKTGSALEVKYQVTDESYHPVSMIWRVLRNGTAYCIQPRNISGFLALRGDSFDDPAIVKHLCKGDCDSFRKADPDKVILDLPCFDMKKDGEQYLVEYPGVKSPSKDIAIPKPSPQARAALANRIANESMKSENYAAHYAGLEHKAIEYTEKYQEPLWKHNSILQLGNGIIAPMDMYDLKVTASQAKDTGNEFYYLVVFKLMPKKDWKKSVAAKYDLSESQLSDNLQPEVAAVFAVDMRELKIYAAAGTSGVALGGPGLAQDLINYSKYAQ